MLPDSVLSYLPSMELFAARRVAEQNEATLANLSNALVQQKNILLGWVNRATEPEELLKACQYLGFVQPMWEAAGYEYKAKEVFKQIIDKAHKMVSDLQEFLAGERKNSKVRNIVSRDLSILREIISA